MSRVTLKQVADHAGVSYQTVSKVLNHQARVTKDTETRILQAVQALGYRPNLIARSLRSNRSHTIGYSWEPALPDQPRSVLDRFLESTAQAAEKAGYYVLVFLHKRGADWVDAYRELIDTNRVDGFVVSSVEYNDPRLSFLQERKFPFVAFGRSNPGWNFPHVDIDGAAGMRMVVDHLLGNGHRRIAALALPEDSRVGENRMEGYLAALHAAGIIPSHELIARGEGSARYGKQAAARLLDGPASQRPTAIVAFNDMMAIGAMEAIREKGLLVGDDIALTGFDDNPMSQYLSPSLTSVSHPVWEVGQQVMSILLGILNQTPPEDTSLLLPPKLIIRESSSLFRSNHSDNS
jgi:DNA-binding LacI/PurR family transcriptional regulator